MAFRMKPLPMAAHGLPGMCLRGVRTVLLFASRLVMTVALLCLLAFGLFYLRLMQGPLDLPVLGRLAAEQLNSGEQDYSVQIGGVVVDLEAGDGLSAVQLTDVVVNDGRETTLISLPRVGAQLGFADLLHGRIVPRNISVGTSDVVITRAEDGHFHLQVGDGAGVSLAAGEAGAESGNTLEAALSQLVDGDPAMDPLRGLRSLRIDGARLVFDDRVLGQAWESQGARLRIERVDGGARAELQADVIDLPGRSAAVRFVAERFKGQRDLHLMASFGQITPGVVAAQMPQLAWLSVLEGTIEGRATAIVGPSGQVKALGGTIFAEQGRLKGWGPDGTFDTAEISFLVDPARDVVRLEQAVLSAKALDTAMYGMARINRDATGNVIGLTGDLTVERIYADLPDLFAAPISFDAGQIAFGWELGENVIEISESTMQAGDVVFRLDGRAVETPEGWDTKFNAAATDMDIQGLLAHWPLATAGTARDWVAEHITSADIPEFSATMRLGQGDPDLALNFRFRSLNSRYLDDMSPIRGAAGTGRMTYNDLYLDFDRARVTPRGHEPIALGGSTVAILDFWGDVTPADIRLVAKGQTKAILALIDEKPLTLVSKLGIDLGNPAGTAEVVADVDFPLIADLRLDQVQADATATLRRLGLNMDLGTDGPLKVSGDGLKLEADTKGMRLRGQVAFDGIPARVDWQETYSGRTQGRTVALQGSTTPKLMGLLGADDLPIDGNAPFDLDLAQQGSGPVRFDLAMDLRPIAMRIDELDWRKAKGGKGRLTASGAMQGGGGGIDIDRFAFSAAGLTAEGAVTIGQGGGLGTARLDRLVLPGLADVRGRVSKGADGVTEVTLTGGQVDLRQQIEGAGDDTGASDGGQPGPPFRLDFTLDQVLVSEKIRLGKPEGAFEQTSAGALGGEISGRLAGQVPVRLKLTRPPEGGGTVLLTSDDAGAALEAADFYRGAKGGRLLVEARIGRGTAPDLEGRARIDDITVRSERTFRSMLRRGGMAEEERMVTNTGLGFRKIWIPFVYDAGVLTLTDAIATGSALALKISGTLDEDSAALDLNGVMSPAYALTGALNEIPVLGDLLSGGEGEGILAMTFTLSGPAKDPDLSINPLSLLTPGFLRNIFRPGDGPSRDFEERINRGKDR